MEECHCPTHRKSSHRLRAEQPAVLIRSRHCPREPREAWRSVTVLPIGRAAIPPGRAARSPHQKPSLPWRGHGEVSLSYPSEEQPFHRAEQPAALTRSRHCPRGAREAWRSVTVLPIGRAAIPPGRAARSPHQKPSLPWRGHGGVSLSYPSEEQPSHRAEQAAVLTRSRHCPRGAREALEECHCPTHPKSSHPTGQSSPQPSSEAVTALGVPERLG
ncbi:hypothetical protein NDU88_011205 [Pleurodeles waltl]|uniref:Uncharacterized protein n=1 Tax=Pleurodeles waltl TaxID=8319 RepID=A0AAV7Q137_PLEWA|nr:hypothetical protein NDU88_011205 [Pleurodeles waltl]